ncbi:MAG: DUF2834 domain-containing protein [Alcanivorax sp.]|nr:DUF2834 domain-containing protein [Alcanivorax sp.]
MNVTTYRSLLYALGAGFAAVFVIVVVPPLIQSRDIIGAIAAGFVNPYSTGYSLDVIFCWFVLAVWVLYEARTTHIRHGWIALVIGLVPGVATGFAAYLLIRLRQERRTPS